MLFKHNPYSFLSGDEPFFPISSIERSGERFFAELNFEIKHEGLIGIPHGGLAMGLCLDAWRQFGVPSYPVDVNFRFGGSGISIGDSAVFSSEFNLEDGSFVSRITKQGDKTPYLRAHIKSCDTSQAGLTSVCDPQRLELEGFRPLPYYRNCFVCGHHRDHPGLKRRFRFHGSGRGTTISSRWGYDTEDFDRAKFFVLSSTELHPAVITSIFDENTAWAGFMDTRKAGLSVKLQFTLLRPVALDERLVFLGWPSGIRGNPKSPKFFVASGSVVSENNCGSSETIAYGRGEWLIMDLYTQQIKKHLLPEHDWEWIFEPQP